MGNMKVGKGSMRKGNIGKGNMGVGKRNIRMGEGNMGIDVTLPLNVSLDLGSGVMRNMT